MILLILFVVGSIVVEAEEDGPITALLQDLLPATAATAFPFGWSLILEILLLLLGSLLLLIFCVVVDDNNDAQ